MPKRTAAQDETARQLTSYIDEGGLVDRAKFEINVSATQTRDIPGGHFEVYRVCLPHGSIHNQHRFFRIAKDGTYEGF